MDLDIDVTITHNYLSSSNSNDSFTFDISNCNNLSYLNRIFIIKRKVVEKNTIMELADYSHLDNLLISIIIITLFVPLITILIIQKSKFKSLD